MTTVAAVRTVLSQAAGALVDSDGTIYSTSPPSPPTSWEVRVEWRKGSWSVADATQIEILTPTSS